MLLADTSILIAHFRNPTAARATLIASELATVPGIVVTEFRAGGRTPAQVLNGDRVLALFGTIATPEAVWDLAGRNQALLATNGLNVPLVDAIIASVAIVAGLELWAYDAHFLAMAALLTGLRLFQEP